MSLFSLPRKKFKEKRKSNLDNLLENLYERGRERLRELDVYEMVVPGVESGFVTGHNREVFEKFHLKMQGIDADFAETKTSLFGIGLDSPIVMSSITSPITQISENGLVKTAKALEEVNSMMWLGSPVPENLEEIADTVPVGQMIKPFKNRGRIFEMVDRVENSESIAYGVDFDSGARTKYGGKRRGPESEPLSSEEIKEIMESSDLPFVLKGILSLEDAEKAMEIGVKNLIVTNHGGHTLDYLPHPLEVLPDLMEVIDRDCNVFVDSGFRRGSDVFKGLAMGADFVMLGRPVLYGLAADGKEGVKEVVRTIENELERTMTMCGASGVGEINENKVLECDFC